MTHSTFSVGVAVFVPRTPYPTLIHCSRTQAFNALTHHRGPRRTQARELKPKRGHRQTPSPPRIHTTLPCVAGSKRIDKPEDAVFSQGDALLV